MSPGRLRGDAWRVVTGALALLVALLVARFTAQRMQELIRPTPTLVARTVIPPYTAIAADQVQVSYLPAAVVGARALRDPAELVGRLARSEILPGMPLLRAHIVPAAELRYTTDSRAVILALAVRPDQAPVELLRPGQRVDVWQADRLLAADLRVVAVSHLPDDRLAVAVEAAQEATPQLLAVSGTTAIGLTIAPLQRLPTPTLEAQAAAKVETEVAATATPTLTATLTLTSTPTPTATPGVAVVRPGPAQGLNVRAGPGTSYPVLVTLLAGSRLTPVGRDAEGRWVEVCCVAGDRYGWVLAELVDLAGDLQSLPVR